MIRNIKMYLRFTGQNIRGLMEYKNDFLVSTIAGFVWQCAGLIFLFAIFNNIHAVGGWTLYEVAMLYGCIMFSEGMVTFGCQGATTMLGVKIHNGEFDRYMVRPLPIMTQLMGGQTNFAGLCTTVTSAAVMVYSLVKLGMTPSILQILLFIINLFLGVWIRVNFDLIGNCAAFYTGGGGMVTLFHNTQNFGKYPVTIFPRLIRYLLFSVFPHGMISYMPVCLLLGKLPVWPYLLAVPASGLFMHFLRRAIFNHTVKRYESVGN